MNTQGGQARDKGDDQGNLDAEVPYTLAVRGLSAADILIADFPNGQHAYLDTREYSDAALCDLIAHLKRCGAWGWHVKDLNNACIRTGK